MAELNQTHDPARKSWIESANVPGCDFPIQNLPFGIFRTGRSKRGGMAIGDRILDLSAALAEGLFSGAAAEAAKAAAGPTLNPLMKLGNKHASALRARVSDLLRDDGPERASIERQADKILVPMAGTAMELPAEIGSFTDFLCSLHHTRRMSLVGELPPSFKSLPIAYHSRATSVRVSGEAVRRPNGQYKTPEGAVKFGPEPSQDYELEFGAFIGMGNTLGSPIAIRQARDHLFGYCLLNDWSARAIQRWESQPLGPFLSKSLSTSISPWVVTAEALAPFRAPAHPRENGDAPFSYLADPDDQSAGGIDIDMEILLLTADMRTRNDAPAPVARTNFRHCYWTFAQMLTHHASNGCNLQPGDLLGSGTLSGPTDESRACLAETTNRGSEPLTLPNGEKRAWLHDGDEVIFRARASRQGYISIGFGECRGRLDPAVAWPA